MSPPLTNHNIALSFQPVEVFWDWLKDDNFFDIYFKNLDLDLLLEFFFSSYLVVCSFQVFDPDLVIARQESWEVCMQKTLCKWSIVV